MTDPVIHVEQIDAAWLTEVLTASGTLSGARITSAQREVCGTGQLADSFRFQLAYEPAGAGPATIVGKFPSEDATSRAFGQQSGYYRNEIRFYEEIAPGLTAAIPTPLHAALADNETDFVLLMDDLSPARAVDQLVGCTADEASAVVEQLAALHAETWHDDRLAKVAWLQGTGLSFSHVTDNFPETISTFQEKFGDLIPDDQLAEAARLNDLDAWKAVFTAPQCLWHSDLRADNLLFDARGGELPVALLDWQGVGYGRGTIDLAYYLGTSLPTETRRSAERDLVGVYQRALTAAGVDGYGPDQAWADYRLAAIHGLQVGVFGLGAVRRSERGDRMWANWIDRAAAHVRDLDSYDVLAAG